MNLILNNFKYGNYKKSEVINNYLSIYDFLVHEINEADSPLNIKFEDNVFEYGCVYVDYYQIYNPNIPLIPTLGSKEVHKAIWILIYGNKKLQANVSTFMRTLRETYWLLNNLAFLKRKGEFSEKQYKNMRRLHYEDMKNRIKQMPYHYILKDLLYKALKYEIKL